MVFFSKFQFTDDLPDAANQKSVLLFFYWKGNVNAIFEKKKTHFLQNNHEPGKSSLNSTLFMDF